MEELDISNFSFNTSIVSCSTPVRPTASRQPRPAAASRSRRPLLKSPQTSGPKKKSTFVTPAPLFKCPHCPKRVYKTERYFKQHMFGHKVQDACSQTASIDELLKTNPEVIDSILTKVKNAVCGDEGEEMKFQAFVEKFVDARINGGCRLFLDTIVAHYAKSVSVQKFIMPSKLWINIFSASESFLSNCDLRESLADNLSEECKEDDRDLIQAFMCEFILCFTDDILTVLRESIVKKPSTQGPTFYFTQEERQDIHFVGGFILHQFMRRAKSFSKNKDWRQIELVISAKLIESENVPGCSEKDKEWTKDKDRGGLTYISEEFMNFLMSLACYLCTVAEPNGSLLKEKIYCGLCTSRPYQIWDKIVGHEEMDEVLSLKFLKGIVKSFSDTFGRGLLLKKLNEVFKTPHASVQLRHSVAPTTTK